MKYNINEFHALRNKIWDDLVASGVTGGDDDDFKAFDSVLGNHLAVDWENQDEDDLDNAIKKIEELKEFADINSGRTDWCDDSVSMEMDWLYGKLDKLQKDLVDTE